MRIKAAIIWNEVIDERGRWMSDEEFRWMVSRFKDIYHPMRLALILARNSGLRIGRVCKLSLRDFTDELKRLKTTQNKPSKRVDEQGVIHLKTKPKNVPLGDPLVSDLYNYITHRLLLGANIGKNLEDIKTLKLFPTVTPQHIRAWLWKLRRKYGNEKPWLLEIYARMVYMDKDRNVIKEVRMYRVAPYESRAYYITKAAEICGNDLKLLQMLSGHDKIEHLLRYWKSQNLEAKKVEIKEKFLDTMTLEQKTPVSINQRTLLKFTE